MHLLRQGVRVTGTDAWSWDAPFVYTARRYTASHNPGIIWEGHRAGREIGYCHIEKLHNLEALPASGFRVAIGSGADVPIPPGTEAFDYELEVAVVIGKPGYNLSVDEAAGHIAGFTILNDWSARDLQSREMRVGLGPAKGKDTATTLGPVLITPDELAAYETAGKYDLTMEVSVNETIIGTDNLANMAWTFAELIAYASRGTWVRPGDILGSGTCGSGCLAELWGWRGSQQPRPLRAGDTVRMTVQGIGTIHNTVIAGPQLHPVPPARQRWHPSRP